MNNGIKIPNHEYRSREGISSTELKILSKSPAHLKYYLEEGHAEDTTAFLFGRAAHKYMLEIDEFYDEFAIDPKIDKRTKAGKEEYATFLDENIGKDIITADQFKQINEMREVLYNTKFVSKLLQGDKELSFFAKDSITGLPIKCRPDCITTVGDSNILIDYKTTDDARTDEFMKKSIKLNYDLQMAYYKDILEQVTGKEYKVVIIAQEKKKPYLVNVLELSDSYIRSGRDLYREMLATYKKCLDEDNYPGYVGDEINILNLPEWLQKLYGEEENGTT